MNPVEMYQIAIGALVSVILILVRVIQKLYRKKEERTDQLIDLALRVKNGDKEILQKVCDVLDRYRAKKKRQGSDG